MSLKKILFIVIGLLSFALGTIGIFLPILPTVPFYLLSAFLFSKASDRLNRWLTNTNFYKKHILEFKERKGLTLKKKLTTTVIISIVMIFGVIMMRRVIVGQICLGIVWLCHMMYFWFIVKTIKVT